MTEVNVKELSAQFLAEYSEKLAACETEAELEALNEWADPRMEELLADATEEEKTAFVNEVAVKVANIMLKQAEEITEA